MQTRTVTLPTLQTRPTKRNHPVAEAFVVLVDKPQGITSHDVVARARKAFGTRKIGHAGTLDPMATGLLVLGVEGATRLLTYIVGLDKTYEATIRLGQTTTTDDADGDLVAVASEEAWDALDPAAIPVAISALTGAISQVPSSVSAIKVDGKRAYDRVRAGEEVELKARAVTVSRFEVLRPRRAQTQNGPVIDLDVVVDCSSGTYIRALARDLGAALGLGGHLVALRRTRIGSFDVADAVAVESLSEVGSAGPEASAILSPADAAVAVLPELSISADTARDLRHGKRVSEVLEHKLAAAIDPDGALVGIVERRGDTFKSVMNMPEVQS